ncbi:uncharacterized protein [Centruroides vittatus]|uniref:uncharacterized protein n=1 Tax=Centruroides vittatus TaxID=120091 RepID=UPI00350FB853
MDYFTAVLLFSFLLRVSLSEVIHSTCTEDENILKPKLENNRYKPNSVTYWRIIPSSKRESVRIEMTVKYIDIDNEAGDYLLIGSSSKNYGNESDIFGGPPPLFLTEKSKNKKLLIATESGNTAYVVLISKQNPKRNARGFEISYQCTGVSVPEEETEPPKYDLWNNAIPLCVKVSLNISEEEVKNDVVSGIITLAEQYIKKKSNRATIRFIRETAINIYTYAKRNDGSFYFLFTITHPNDETKPLFTSDQLRKILYNQDYDSYHFKDCREIFQDKTEMYFIYATIPFFFVFFLFVWWWRYNQFWNSRFKTEEEIKNDTPITLNIEMYPTQMNNPVYQPDSPTSICQYGKESAFSFSKPSFVKKEAQRTESNDSWSEQSARNRKISRKKFVSFAVPQIDDDDDDNDDDDDDIEKNNVSDTTLKTSPPKLEDTKL